MAGTPRGTIPGTMTMAGMVLTIMATTATTVRITMEVVTTRAEGACIRVMAIPAPSIAAVALMATSRVVRVLPVLLRRVPHSVLHLIIVPCIAAIVATSVVRPAIVATSAVLPAIAAASVAPPVIAAASAVAAVQAVPVVAASAVAVVAHGVVAASVVREGAE